MAEVKGNSTGLFKTRGQRITTTYRDIREVIYSGPYDLCLSHRPARGSVSAEYPDLVVEEATVTKMPGGFGELRIVYGTDEGDDEEGNPKKPTYEWYWAQETRALKEHPRFRTGGELAIADTEWPKIRAWEAASTESDMDAAYEGLTSEAKQLVDYLAKGQESYMFYLPVAVIVSQHYAQGSARACGKKISGKPFPECPDGYEWLRSGDRWSRTGRRGKWVRTQTFNGYPDIDTDIYGEEEA